MVLKPLSKAVSYKERVYNELKTAIISLKIAPGEILNERDLAEKLGISRTPIREALQILENEGLVVTEPWKGTRVKEITEEDIEEVFQLRMVLEPLAVELAIPKMTAEDDITISNLHSKQSAFCKETEADEFIKSDMCMHMQLANLAGNKRLITIVGNLMDTMRRLGVSAVQTKERFQETLDEHSKLIRALKERDLLKARQAMIYHVLRTKESVYRHLRGGNLK